MVQFWKNLVELQDYVINYNKNCYYGETSSALEIHETEKDLSTIPFDYQNILQEINQFGFGPHTKNQRENTLNKNIQLLSTWLNFKEGNFGCPPCRKIFATGKSKGLQGFLHHIKYTHLKLRNRNEKRVRKPEPENERTCPICKKIFAFRSSLKQHILRVCNTSSKDVFKCPECDKKFLMHRLKNHINAYHTKRIAYPCGECSRIFYTASSRSNHIFYHHNKPNPVECQICHKMFLRKDHLKNHEKIHTITESNFECQICKAKLKTKYTLAYHLLSHNKSETERRKIECKICHKLFTSKGKMLVHLSIHTGERPYQCNFCGDSFRLQSCLSQHYMKHTQEKPYKCSECGKAFALKHHLDNHLKTHSAKQEFKE